MMRLYTSFVAAGMFFVRMLLLGLMALLQLTVGGADLSRPTSQAGPATGPAAAR